MRRWCSWSCSCLLLCVTGPSADHDASSGFCDGEGVMMYAGEGCTNAEGGGGMEIFMLDLVEERVELRERLSSDEEDMIQAVTRCLGEKYVLL